MNINLIKFLEELEMLANKHNLLITTKFPLMMYTSQKIDSHFREIGRTIIIKDRDATIGFSINFKNKEKEKENETITINR